MVDQFNFEWNIGFLKLKFSRPTPVGYCWRTVWLISLWMFRRQCCFLFNVSGNGISVEGALLTEQDVNHPKPAKRARTSFTADQLQVEAVLKTWVAQVYAGHGCWTNRKFYAYGGKEKLECFKLFRKLSRHSMFLEV